MSGDDSDSLDPYGEDDLIDGDDLDDGYDDDGYDDDGYDDGPTRISVVDRRGRPVGVSIQTPSDMLPPSAAAGRYANVRRRSRF